MQLFHDVRQAHLAGPTFLTIGNFDGIHLGHRALFRTLQQLAAATQVERASNTSGTEASAEPNVGILTFDPHPLAVLRPELAPPILTTPQERIELVVQMGLNLGVVQPFTHEIAALRAVEFMTLLKRHLGLHTLVVGPDFALGRDRSGDIERLRELGDELDYRLVVVELVERQNASVRSSRIRELLAAGDVAAAAELLGRWYRISGTVMQGDRRGRLLGTPTANLAIPANRFLPADGVYATRTTIRNRVERAGDAAVFYSVTNLGVRPTVDGQQHRVETHLLDFPPTGVSGDLYGETLDVEFVARLRGERRFDGVDALKTQIQTDIAQARQLFAENQTHMAAESQPHVDASQ